MGKMSRVLEGPRSPTLRRGCGSARWSSRPHRLAGGVLVPPDHRRRSLKLFCCRPQHARYPLHEWAADGPKEDFGDMANGERICVAELMALRFSVTTPCARLCRSPAGPRSGLARSRSASAPIRCCRPGFASAPRGLLREGRVISARDSTPRSSSHCRSTKRISTKPQLLDVGAAYVIAAEEADLVGEVMRITSGLGARVAFDPVGPSELSRSHRRARSIGHHIGQKAEADRPTIDMRVGCSMTGCRHNEFAMVRKPRTAMADAGELGLTADILDTTVVNRRDRALVIDALVSSSNLRYLGCSRGDGADRRDVGPGIDHEDRFVHALDLAGRAGHHPSLAPDPRPVLLPRLAQQPAADVALCGEGGRRRSGQATGLLGIPARRSEQLASLTRCPISSSSTTTTYSATRSASIWSTKDMRQSLPPDGAYPRVDPEDNSFNVYFGSLQSVVTSSGQGTGSAAGGRCVIRRHGQRHSGNISRRCRSGDRDAVPATRRSSLARPGGDRPRAPPAGTRRRRPSAPVRERRVRSA